MDVWTPDGDRPASDVERTGITILLGMIAALGVVAAIISSLIALRASDCPAGNLGGASAAAQIDTGAAE